MSARLQIAPAAPAEFISEFPELHSVIAQILYTRGLRTQEEIDIFFTPDYSRDLHDPFLFKDMKKTIARIITARDKKEKVLIYGDYDADGVCSAVLLYSALLEVGVANVEIYLPHRDTEGYGLNEKAIEQFALDNTDLIITVDCGISNKQEVQQATDLGMDIIVTDHHVEPLELPTAAYAIINPQIKSDTYPFAMLAGVGVAFKVVQALGQTLDMGEGFEKWLLDLVAISTVTDCMPLLDENRTLVKYGLVVLNKTKRLGLQKLILATHKPGNEVSTSTIAYRIGPWINAAGRVGHANSAVDLLRADEVGRADIAVEKLEATNKDRQAQTEKMYKQAIIQAEAQADNAVIYVFAEEWPLGLVGLVAGKLVTAYGKPAFVMTRNNGEISGSGRSMEGLNMIASLQQLEHLFDRYGGHAMACGFTLNKDITPEKFEEDFLKLAAPIIEQLEPGRVLHIDAELDLKSVNWDLVEQLEQLEPFGEKNPRPQFLVRSAIVKDFQTVGKTNSHLRLLLTDATKTKIVKAIAFGFGEYADKLSLGEKITVVAEANVNEWNGNREIQLQIVDIQDD